MDRWMTPTGGYNNFGGGYGWPGDNFFGGYGNRGNWPVERDLFDNRSNWPATNFGGNWPVGNFGNFGNFGNLGRDLSRDFRNFDRNFNRMFHDMEKNFSSELNLQPTRPSSMLEHYSLTHPVRYDAEGNRWLNCYFDLRSYKPEEINVTLDSKNRYLNVDACHEVKDKEHHVKRHYSRKVYIPEDLKVDLSKLDLKSCLNNEGQLCVEAALPKLSIEEARAYTGPTKSLVTSEPHLYKVATKTV